MNKEQFIARFTPQFGRYSVICGFVAFALWIPPFILLLVFLPGVVGRYVPPVLNFIGLALGIMAIVNRRRRPAEYPASGLAWFGCLLNIAVFVTIGLVIAHFGNSKNPSLQRHLSLAIEVYTWDHDGALPTSLAQVDMPPETPLIYVRYYFYHIHIERPLLLNKHLAGQKVDSIAFPERTILVAPGKVSGPVGTFSTLNEIDVSPHSNVTMLNWSSYNIPNGKNRWLVYPVFKQHGGADEAPGGRRSPGATAGHCPTP